MNINEIKDLMAQFDQSSLREFSYKNQSDELTFSKNEGQVAVPTASAAPIAAPLQAASAPVIEPTPQAAPSAEPKPASEVPAPAAEGDVLHDGHGVQPAHGPSAEPSVRGHRAGHGGGAAQWREHRGAAGRGRGLGAAYPCQREGPGAAGAACLCRSEERR